MGEIKSAREIAMEKIEKIGELTEEEKLKWKYFPEGEKLAARYLKHDADLASEMAKLDKKIIKIILQGASDVLIKNITLPKDEISKANTKRAMDGLKLLKTDKAALENVYSKIKRVFSHYSEQGEQQRQQAYESLKAEYEQKVMQALQKQLGSSASNLKIDIEKQPGFLEEWHKLKSRLDVQYVHVLEEFKQELVGMR